MLNPELIETEIGFEWDKAACDTRAAAGFNTIQTDIAQYPLHQFNGKVTGLIASPPCQDFSLAGKRAGVDGDRGQLIGEVLRWVDALQPEWVACEQVPPALPVWRDYAETLRGWGFHVWCGILNAANYGVPQSRRRAFLIASKHHQVGPPEPTHDESPEPSLFGDGLLPWVSMSESIGAKHLLRSNQADPSRPFDERGKQPAKKVGGGDWYFRMPPEKPCWTLTSNTGAWRWESPEGDIKITVEQALILQSFPAAYPLQGSKTKQFEQVGNACVGNGNGGWCAVTVTGGGYGFDTTEQHRHRSRFATKQTWPKSRVDRSQLRTHTTAMNAATQQRNPTSGRD